MLKNMVKDKGKFIPYTITPDIQKRISSFKKRLKEMDKNDEVSTQHSKIIKYLFNRLDEYDLNLLIAYYEIANQSPSALAKILNISPSVINSRIKKIISQCKQSLT